MDFGKFRFGSTHSQLNSNRQADIAVALAICEYRTNQVSARRRGRSAEGNRLLHFPRWAAPINWGVALVLGHLVLPWWVSLHSVRHGWSGGLPRGRNLIGILPVSAGLAIIVWALGLHFVSAKQA